MHGFKLLSASILFCALLHTTCFTNDCIDKGRGVREQTCLSPGQTFGRGPDCMAPPQAQRLTAQDPHQPRADALAPLLRQRTPDPHQTCPSSAACLKRSQADPARTTAATWRKKGLAAPPITLQHTGYQAHRTSILGAQEIAEQAAPQIHLHPPRRRETWVQRHRDFGTTLRMIRRRSSCSACAIATSCSQPAQWKGGPGTSPCCHPASSMGG